MSSLIDDNNNNNNIISAGRDGQQPSILGSPCSVRGPDGSVKRGQLLEVRYLWTPLLISDTPKSKPPALYGFVRVKDVDHRLSGWFPASDIELKEPRGSNNNNNNSNNNNNNTGLSTGNMTPPPQTFIRITKPILSSVYWEETPGMTRTRREEKQHDFFEERLLRDCRTPTTIRYFVYLCTYVFAPWYYAPYGIFHTEYDPAASCSSEEQRFSGITETTPTNPYIRDAYLCPFSLRIYSTFEQMQYETRLYRSGRLQPPGQEIYRDDARGFSMFEVNGSRQVTYCRHLFLLGKSFLENKLAGYDVQNYYFYIVCLHQRHFPQYTDDPAAMYFVGYFTWEKQVVDNNLACIVTLPCFAGGSTTTNSNNSNNNNNNNTSVETTAASVGHFGQFMIAASYELAYRRRHVGSPEKPLSDLGAAAYHRYWLRVLLAWMHTQLPHTTAPVITIDDNEMDSNNNSNSNNNNMVEEVEVLSDDEDEDDDENEEVVDQEEEEEEEEEQEEDDDNDNEENEHHTNSNNKSSKSSKSHNHNRVGGVVGRGRGVKRFRTSSSNTNNNNNNNNTTSTSTGELISAVTVHRIAQEVRIDPADVLRTLLRAGLLHRNAEDRSLRLVIPAACVRREMARTLQHNKDMTRAVFDASLLLTRGGIATTTAGSLLSSSSTTTTTRQAHTPQKQRP